MTTPSCAPAENGHPPGKSDQRPHATAPVHEGTRAMHPTINPTTPKINVRNPRSIRRAGALLAAATALTLGLAACSSAATEPQETAAGQKMPSAASSAPTSNAVKAPEGTVGTDLSLIDLCTWINNQKTMRSFGTDMVNASGRPREILQRGGVQSVSCEVAGQGPTGYVKVADVVLVSGGVTIKDGNAPGGTRKTIADRDVIEGAGVGGASAAVQLSPDVTLSIIAPERSSSSESVDDSLTASVVPLLIKLAKSWDAKDVPTFKAATFEDPLALCKKADLVAALQTTPLPVERTAALYAEGRAHLDPGDQSPLQGEIFCGTAGFDESVTSTWPWQSPFPQERNAFMVHFSQYPDTSTAETVAPKVNGTATGAWVVGAAYDDTAVPADQQTSEMRSFADNREQKATSAVSGLTMQSTWAGVTGD